MKTKVKILTTPDLIWFNRQAVKANRNRSMVDDIEMLLDPEGTHVVQYTLLHNDFEIRTLILMKFTDRLAPVEGWLDMSIEDFDKLQEVEA